MSLGREMSPWFREPQARREKPIFPEWATDPLRPMFNGAQLWVCKKCGTKRQWGENAPLEISNEDAWLRCLKCDTVTLHFYGGVHRGWAKEFDEGR
jgi:hypothetical protein